MNIKSIITCASAAAAIGMGATAFASGGSSGCVTATEPNDGSWENPPVAGADGFVFVANDKKEPSVLTPAEERTKDVLTTEFALCFDNNTTEDTVPDSALGGVIIVKDSAGVYRFACRIESVWTTNQVLVADRNREYLLQATFDNKQQLATYRIKSGDEPYELIHTGKFSGRSNGKVGFTGKGNLKEVRWEDHDAK